MNTGWIILFIHLAGALQSWVNVQRTVLYKTWVKDKDMRNDILCFS